MMLNQILLSINCIACAYTCLRLLFFRRHDHFRFRRSVSAFAYVLAVFNAAVSIRILTGLYSSPVDIAEVFINVAMAIAIHRAKGNAARLLDPERRNWSKRPPDIERTTTCN